MHWEKVTTFLKSHLYTPKTIFLLSSKNQIITVSVFLLFATNRFIFEKFPPPPPLLYSRQISWSVLPGFLPSFPSQIWVSDVTFSGDKKASHLSHFWEECDALAHQIFFITFDVFGHILPEKRHILAPPVQNFFEREEM